MKRSMAFFAHAVCSISGGPIAPGLVVIDFLAAHGASHGLIAGIGRAHPHPFFKSIAFAVAELGLGRHLEIGICVTDSVHQWAVFRPPRYDSGTRVSACLPASSAIEPESAFALSCLLGMTLVTALDEDGTDLCLKKGTVLR